MVPHAYGDRCTHPVSYTYFFHIRILPHLAIDRLAEVRDGAGSHDEVDIVWEDLGLWAGQEAGADGTGMVTLNSQDASRSAEVSLVGDVGGSTLRLEREKGKASQLSWYGQRVVVGWHIIAE